MEENKKKKSKAHNIKIRLIGFNILAFISMLVLPTFFWIILSTTNLVFPSIMETLDFDTGENREKTQFEISDGANSFFSDVERWYNDRVPFRSVILTTQQEFLNKIEEPYIKTIRPALINLFHSKEPGGEYDSGFIDSDKNENLENSEHKYELISKTEPDCMNEGIEIYRCKKCGHEETVVTQCGHKGEVIKIVAASVSDYGYKLNKCSACGSEYRSEITNRLPDSTYLPLINHGYAVEGKHNWLFYNGDNNLSYYYGSNLLSDKELSEYNAELLKLQELCDKKGIELRYMIMPNKEQVYSEFMPNVEVQNEVKRVEILVEHVKNNSGIEIVYPLEALEKAKPYWQVYRKHDTHWNSAGAYIGTQELYKSLGLDATDLMRVKVTEKNISGGDLINLGGLSKDIYSSDINYNIEYKREVEILSEDGNKSGSGTFVSQSSSDNKCNFVMISDSFRNAMIPFLEKDFSCCTITHRNNINNSDVKKAILDADVLVVAVVERSDKELLESVRKTITILSQS